MVRAVEAGAGPPARLRYRGRRPDRVGVVRVPEPRPPRLHRPRKQPPRYVEYLRATLHGERIPTRDAPASIPEWARCSRSRNRNPNVRSQPRVPSLFPPLHRRGRRACSWSSAPTSRSRSGSQPTALDLARRPLHRERRSMPKSTRAARALSARLLRQVARVALYREQSHSARVPEPGAGAPEGGNPQTPFLGVRSPSRPTAAAAHGGAKGRGSRPRRVGTSGGGADRSPIRQTPRVRIEVDADETTCFVLADADAPGLARDGEREGAACRPVDQVDARGHRSRGRSSVVFATDHDRATRARSSRS